MLDKLVNWVVENRRGNAFVGYTREMIEAELLQAFEQNTLAVSYDKDGNITGVIVACNLLYIKQILTKEQGVLKKLCRDLRSWFPRIPWAATRHGKQKIYLDVNPMINKQISILEEEVHNG
jgi:hypothetical protein